MARPLHPRSAEEIVAVVIPLFARAGYNGVSMREVAKAAGLSPAALYHHFADKQALYLAAMAQAFAPKAAGLRQAIEGRGEARERLARFIVAMARSVQADPDFCKLVLREMLDGDEARLKLLAEQVFRELFEEVAQLGREAAPGRDSHLLAVSLVGLVVHHYQAATMRPHLPGYHPSHEDPEVLASHLIALLGLNN